MNAINKLPVIVLLIIYSNTAFALCVQNNNALSGLVGLDSADNTIYATTVSTSNECSCTNVRFRAQNTNTQMVLSILLSAKIANQKVRIDLLDTNDCNSAFRVYVQ